jgi:hypothetical protein
MGMQGKGFARVHWLDALGAPLQAFHSLGMECDANDPLEKPSD